ncbi:MAG TPA: CDP-diacylglycerol--glycerol-3-phosphate 3-phosphatidyltransferase [Eubacteriales bacterium]|nr:CDP-diacylglycerol--glycerol-3-phosphate 3-phosphatidyltransferase [Eubacteriales bacterium]
MTQNETNAQPSTAQDEQQTSEQNRKFRLNLPNRLTIFRMVLVPLMVAAFSFDHWLPWWNYLAAGIFFVADMTDIVDGYIARTRNMVTNFGKLMDPIADKLLFCSAFIMMTWNGMLNPILCIIFVGREIIVSGFRLVTASSGKVIAANWLGKLKSTLQVIAILWTLLGNPIFSRWNFAFDFGVMCTAAVFTIWSAVDYIIANWKAVKWD